MAHRKLKPEKRGFATAAATAAGPERWVQSRDHLCRDRRLHAVGAGFFFANGEGPEAEGEDDEAGNIPPKVLSEAVIEDAEPGEHLAEQPTTEAFRDAELRAAPLRKAAVVEAHVYHLHERVQPREHSDAAKLDDEVRSARGRRAQGVEDPHDETEEKRQPEQHGAHVRESLGSEPIVPVRHLARGIQTGNGWDHEFP